MSASGENGTRFQIELEEYRQVLEERRFVMTRYMQAIGLYLLLSSWVLKLILDMKVGVELWALLISFSVLNSLGIVVANRFESMAAHALARERYFVTRFQVRQHHELFWGYWFGVMLVILVVSVSWTICLVKAGYLGVLGSFHLP